MIHHPHIKNSVMPYVGNVATFLFASVAYIEAVDLSIKIVSLSVAIVVFIFTVRRHRIDLKIKRRQLEQEDHRLYILMEQSKQIGRTSNGQDSEKIKIE